MKFKRNRVFWCRRGFQPVAIGYVPTEKAWRRLMKAEAMGEPWPMGQASRAGYTVLLTHSGTGASMVLVTLDAAAHRHDTDLHRTIVHEAVHVWQFINQAIGTKASDIEHEAYGIQCIIEELHEAFLTTTRRKKLVIRRP